MNRYVVLGVNENPKYLYYIPLVIWAWRRIGFEPIMFHNAGICFPYDFAGYELQPINGYKSETLAQVSRLYGACCVDDDSYLVTSDIDMLPLDKNLFHYEGHRVLTIGRDLTDYHYPICYVGARQYVWKAVMSITCDDYQTLIQQDLRQQKNMWGLDQDILTEKLLIYGKENINHIDRGTDKRTGYPIGRVDRSNWRLDHERLIDAHLPHDILTNEKSFQNVLQLLHHVWPKEDFKWYVSYHKEFKKLL